MRLHLPFLISLGMLGTMVFLSIGLWSALPAGTMLPIHFGPDGTPDRMASAAFALFLLPAIMLFVLTVFMLAPRISSRPQASPVLYVGAWLFAIFALSVGHGLIIRQALFLLSRA